MNTRHASGLLRATLIALPALAGCSSPPACELHGGGMEWRRVLIKYGISDPDYYTLAKAEFPHSEIVRGPWAVGDARETTIWVCDDCTKAERAWTPERYQEYVVRRREERAKALRTEDGVAPATPGK
jgi:hypothetical protein